jgi:nickel-type superoxide dismutase maturation protease
VTGESLSPFLSPGDYILTLKLPFVLKRIRPGDVVVFHHPVYGTMVKRVERIDNVSQELEVVGEHLQSTDSRQFGAIPRRWLIGKVIWQFKKLRKSKQL